MSEPIPSPGSPAARSQGCKRSGRKNANGSGAAVVNGKALFWEAPDCPLHARESAVMPKDPETMELGLFGEGK